MKVLSLFSGAGGADLALEAAGFDIAALCEIEPHARAVLREHWPTVPLHGDVCELDGTQYRGVDVVVGGSPCQDLSVAGKREGLGGDRSVLFHQQVRIWNESGASYLIWENVKGAFSSADGADFAAVLSAIVGTAIPVPRDGWRNAGVVAGPTAVAAWRLLDLQHFGVPQRRERIVVVAARAGGVDPAEVLALGESVRGDSAPRFAAREGTATGAADGAGSAREVVAVNISDGRATLDDVMGTLDTDGASTTAIGAQTRGVVLTFDARGNGDGQVANTMAGDHQNRVTDYTALVVMASGQANAERAENVSTALTALHEAPIVFTPGIPRRLMPIECERLMGWPDDHTRFGVDEHGRRYELKDTPRYKLCGNGIGREWMEYVGLKLMQAVLRLTSAPQP